MKTPSRPAPRVGRLAGCVAIALGLAAATAASAYGGQAAPKQHDPLTHQVLSCDDMSLRQAITSALDGDTVAMPMGCGLITLTAGEIPIAVDNLTITGPGADQFTIDGGQTTGYYNRVFRHHGTGTLSISGVTISGATTNNSTDPNGGCIDSDGTVKLYQSVVKNCYMQADTGLNAQGGAIYAKLGVELHSSTVSANTATALQGFSSGGGVFSNGYFLSDRSTISDNLADAPGMGSGFGGGVFSINGDVQIQSSTLSGNKADTGGGLFVSYAGQTAVAYIVDSTISGNEATAFVGGASFHVPATVLNSTIFGNTSASTASGVGVYALTTFSATSSIFANNLKTAGDPGVDIYAVLGTIDGANDIIVSTPNTPPAFTITDCPKLGPLADNGGPTLTHEPMPGSPALDAGANPLTLQFDQRGDGYMREFGAMADIGAVEWQGTPQDGIFTSRFELACD